ncbi:MAG: hypothetical protein A2W25_12965 [candidate division Zixibacteria bacterium RBG_16_53_22]|nr:MAG: hypothetical protein A2W25_12965 [candidate division Zixibacteria bacterium RBG_16_53_22]
MSSVDFSAGKFEKYFPVLMPAAGRIAAWRQSWMRFSYRFSFCKISGISKLSVLRELAVFPISKKSTEYEVAPSIEVTRCR